MLMCGCAADLELAEKLGQELRLERDNREGPPDILQEYIENGPFKVRVRSPWKTSNR